MSPRQLSWELRQNRLSTAHTNDLRTPADGAAPLSQLVRAGKIRRNPYKNNYFIRFKMTRSRKGFRNKKLHT